MGLKISSVKAKKKAYIKVQGHPFSRKITHTQLNPRTGRTRNPKPKKNDDPIALIESHLSRVSPTNTTTGTAWENINNQYRRLMNLILSGRISVSSNEAIEIKHDNGNSEALELSKTFDVIKLE